MRVLVTGGAGFIGSHLGNRLLEAGERVTALDDLSTGRRENVAAGVDLRVGDVRDAAVVEDAVRGVDLVVHLAAAVGTRVVARDPAGTWSRNVQGTAAVLDACARHGRRVIIASSSEVYGPGRERPLAENDASTLLATGRRDVYALSKAAGEAYAMALFRARLLPVTVIRFFNVVGARQSDRYGMVLPRFAAEARAGRPLPVYGDGSQQRCFLHVDDAVDALLALAPVARTEGEVVNVGSRKEIRILDLARLVIEEAGGCGRIEFVPFERVFGEGFPDPRRRVPDVGRLEQWTGFRARRSVRDAVRDSLAVYASSAGASSEAASRPPKLSATARRMH